jgi:hypothetical protein
MTPRSTFDPFDPMEFIGYIDPVSGRQDKYLSLAHFIHSERMLGVDESYRNYLLNLGDAELFRLEVDAVGFTGSDKSSWSELRQRMIYAGIFMQALSNREYYGHLIANAEQLSIAHCSFSDAAALAMGEFIGDLHSDQNHLKVLFLGGGNDKEYIASCLGVLFAKRAPQCLLALEDDGCSVGISNFARERATPFSLLSSALTTSALAESIQARCTHVFYFEGGNDSRLTVQLLEQFRIQGITITPIQSKP